jgi:hypothetical protein
VTAPCGSTWRRRRAGIYARVSDGLLHAEFELAADLFPDRRSAVHLFQHARPADPAGSRITLADGPVKPGSSPSSANVLGRLGFRGENRA